HDKKLTCFFRKMIAHFRQSRVAQPCKQSRLSLKSFFQVLFMEKSLFQSNSITEPLIRRLINSTHTALSNQTHNQVTVLQNSISSEHIRKLPQRHKEHKDP